MKKTAARAFLTFGIFCFAACSKPLVGPRYPSHTTVALDAYIHSEMNLGPLGMLAVEGDETTDIRDLELRHQLLAQLGGLWKYFIHPAPEIEIARVDKDLLWILNAKKNTYTECPLLGCALPQMARRTTKKCPLRLADKKISVKKTGETRTINGFDATEYRVAWTVAVEDAKKLKNTADFTLDLWTAPESDARISAARPVLDRYAENFMVKAGLAKQDPAFSRVVPARAFQILMERMTGSLTQREKREVLAMTRAFSKIKGYPVSSKIDLYMDSRACQAPKPHQASTQPQQSKLNFTSVGGFLSSAANWGVQKKMSQNAAETANQPIYRLIKEIKKISVDQASDGLFEIPPGYQLVNRK